MSEKYFSCKSGKKGIGIPQKQKWYISKRGQGSENRPVYLVQKCSLFRVLPLILFTSSLFLVSSNNFHTDMQYEKKHYVHT